MKRWVSILLFVLLPLEGWAADGGFVHPGLMHSQADLVFVRRKLAAGEEPWTSAWHRLRSDYVAGLRYTPKPVAHVSQAPYGKEDVGAAQMMKDSSAAYCQALQWCLTGEKAHAVKAIEILNGWSYMLQSISGDKDQGKVVAGWTAGKFCNAAELLRYSSAGWAERDVRRLKRMLLEIHYPLIKDFQPRYNGNWDAAMIHSMLSIGVFCDDREKFDRAVDYFLHGKGKGALTNYVFPAGQCQETTRDQTHTQMGLGALAAACEVAWKQGVDLYGAADNRLALGLEYTAKYNLGHEVPCTGVIGEKGRGHFQPIWEAAYQHYVYEKGLKMPYLQQVLAKVRPEGWSPVVTESFGTLTCFKGPPRSDASSTDAKPASPRGAPVNRRRGG
jgi:hypothetical protein